MKKPEGKKKVEMRNKEIKFFSVAVALCGALPQHMTTLCLPQSTERPFFFFQRYHPGWRFDIDGFPVFFSYLFYLECCPLSSASASTLAVASVLLCCVAALSLLCAIHCCIPTNFRLLICASTYTRYLPAT